MIRRATLAGLAIAYLSSTAHPGEGARASRLATLLQEWRVADARVIAERDVEQFGRKPAALLDLATVRFYEARYREALDLIEEAKRAGGGPLAPGVAKFHALVAGVWTHAKRYETAQSAHFSLRFDPAKDRVLVQAALDCLERTHDAIAADLGFRPAERVVVEICPSADAFARGSTLDKKDIERSGTIALCKFNRLMITTPRVTFHGYRWLDTLCHEYVHYALMKLTRNRTPLWLHEGIAKYHETRWRSPRGGRLTPVSESLLASAVEAGRLVTFKQMNPSFAMLSAEEATLAFAEVNTMVELMIDRAGHKGLRLVLAALAADTPIDDALRPITRGGLDRFYGRWLKYVKGKKLTRIEGLHLERPRLREHPDGKERDAEDVDLLRETASSRVADFVRLGDMLRREGRAKAAVQEYEKADAAAPGLSPIVRTRLAFAHMEAHDLPAAEKALALVCRVYPDFQPGHALTGAMRFQMGHIGPAIDALQEAVAINPFDYVSRTLLAQAYGRAGQNDLQQRERAALKLLGGR